ncbi:MAG: AAA family ATPase [Patescibacteria group bacterium]
MRIAVIGSQNTGKSTFVGDFLAEFPEYSTPRETYRDIVRKGNLAINQKTTQHNQRLIRDFLFDQSVHNLADDILFDRCVVDNYIYTLAQFEKGGIEELFMRETEEMMYRSLDNLDALVFIPTAVSVRLVDDALRDTDTLFIDRVNCLFIETLLQISQQSSVKIVAIAGNREERIGQVRKSLGL